MDATNLAIPPRDIETIERAVARFILSLRAEGYEPVDIAAALSAGAGAVMDEEGA